MSSKDDPKVHVWITKYALTQGIFEVDARRCDSADQMIEVPGSFSAYYHKPYWHESREEAVSHAKQMRDKKVASIEKKLKKLREMEF